MEYVKPLRVRQIPLLPTTLRKEYPLPKTDEISSIADEIRNLENIEGAKYIKLKGQGGIENIMFNGSI